MKATRDEGLVELPAGPADEGPALVAFFGARRLTDGNKLRVRPDLAQDGLVLPAERALHAPRSAGHRFPVDRVRRLALDALDPVLERKRRCIHRDLPH